jgi:Putative transmembrane protein (PGPGW).
MKSVEQEESPPRIIVLFGRRIRMPRSRGHRVAIGVGFLIGGCLWFLPVFGIWMIPLGLLILSHEFARVRRMRRRAVVWWERRRRK